MSVVNELYKVTEALYEEVQRELSNEDREKQIEQISKLLQERQILVDKLQPPYTEEENKIGAQIVKHNKVIEAYLQKIFADIKMDIKQLKIKKEKSTKYSNPYESISMDGMFFDKRN